MSDSVDTTVDATSSRELIKRALSHGKKGRIDKDLSNKIMLGVFRAALISPPWCCSPSSPTWSLTTGATYLARLYLRLLPQGVNAEGGIGPRSSRLST